MPNVVQCAKCNQVLPKSQDFGESVTCDGCATPFEMWTFPALRRKKQEGAQGELTVLDDEASCFYHAERKAVVPCSECGRFLCQLCDLELDGKHSCPACLERVNDKDEGRVNSRFCYDSLALSISILSFLMWFLTILTAPVVLFIVVRYWRVECSILKRSKIRFVLAALVALAQIGGWIFAAGAIGFSLLEDL